MHSFQSPLYRSASQKPFSFRKCLQERCKGHEKNFGVCRNAASVTKNFLAFAGMLQVPRKIFWHLQECCKCHEIFFGVCRNAASVTKNFLAFAGTLQVPREIFWHLQECCKRHEIFFGLCWNAAKAERMEGAPSPPAFPPSLFKRLRIVSRTSKKESFYRFFIEKKA